MSAELLLAANNIVGESIIWSPEEKALYWVDIVGRRIHRYEPASGRSDDWATPELVTSIGLGQQGKFVVGLRNSVALWEPEGVFEHLATPEPKRPDNRLNEGVVAPDGSFWVGTMQNNIDQNGTPKPMTAHGGAYYRILPTGRTEKLTESHWGITNTMVWSDGRFVTADTLENRFFEFELTSEGLSNKRELGTPLQRGLPDGSTLDQAGLMYNTRVGGGAIAIIAPDGDLRKYLEVPVPLPTSCTFGGDELGTLFITSARFGLDRNELDAYPLSGGLFAIELDCIGTPSHRFGAL